MESTGKYWIPVYNILEKDCSIVLAHPKYVKAIRGKKTDKKDAKWIADLFKHDLVSGSFMPPADILSVIHIFSYCNPTKLYFGEDSLNYLNEELQKYGKNVVLVYGGGSIKKNGIYDEVIEILKKNGKNVAEIAGVMPNPTLAKLRCV